MLHTPSHADPPHSKRIVGVKKREGANVRTLDEQEIYDELPAKLRADLLLHRYKEIVEKVPFFRNCNDGAISIEESSFPIEESRFPNQES